jgi:hypothetical protein
MSAMKRVQKAVRERRVELSEHALEEMDDDNLTLPQVLTVLRHDALYKTHKHDPRGTQYLVRGAAEDDDVEVVCRFIASGILRVITVYEVDDE